MKPGISSGLLVTVVILMCKPEPEPSGIFMLLPFKCEKLFYHCSKKAERQKIKTYLTQVSFKFALQTLSILFMYRKILKHSFVCITTLLAWTVTMVTLTKYALLRRESGITGVQPNDIRIYVYNATFDTLCNTGKVAEDSL